jgi:hypothetical protein
VTNTINLAIISSISAYNDDQLVDKTNFMGYNFPNLGLRRDSYDANSHSYVKQIQTLVFTGREGFGFYRNDPTVASVSYSASATFA